MAGRQAAWRSVAPCPPPSPRGTGSILLDAHQLRLAWAARWRTLAVRCVITARCRRRGAGVGRLAGATARIRGRPRRRWNMLALSRLRSGGSLLTTGTRRRRLPGSSVCRSRTVPTGPRLRLGRAPTRSCLIPGRGRAGLRRVSLRRRSRLGLRRARCGRHRLQARLAGSATPRQNRRPRPPLLARRQRPEHWQSPRRSRG